MFNLSSRQAKPTEEDGDTREPLLGQGNGHALEDRVIFAVADEDEDELDHDMNSADGEREPGERSRSVRFQEDVRVIGPPLRSTAQSREARE